jgi:hypothetical protein
MSEEECLTLGQLQLAKRITQRQDELLRSKLVKLRRDRPDGWKKKVKDVRDELARRNGRVGHLEYRIAAAEREEHDV